MGRGSEMKKMLEIVLTGVIFFSMIWTAMNYQDEKFGGSFSLASFYDQKKVLPQILERHYDIKGMQDTVLLRAGVITGITFPGISMRVINCLNIDLCDGGSFFNVVVEQRGNENLRYFLFTQAGDNILDDVNKNISSLNRVGPDLFYVRALAWDSEVWREGKYSKEEIESLYSFSALLEGVIERYITFFEKSGDTDKASVLRKELMEIRGDWRMTYLSFYLEKEGFKISNTDIEFPFFFSVCLTFLLFVTDWKRENEDIIEIVESAS